MLIEYLWRGYSHISMYILGGIIFLIADIQNERIEWERPLWRQIFFVWVITLAAEFITGMIVNVWLGLYVWDYSEMPFNLLGQVCLPYALLFIPLCIIAIVYSDYCRYYLYGEEKPRYTLCKGGNRKEWIG
ncbi:hypothetical protein LJC51_09015 [Lachnospiraceae bacterium OttesenSCG-928-J05]|nr:hypothetical protein [Lachnospiraceae bacterium OttesenSCG-928-J05]